MDIPLGGWLFLFAAFRLNWRNSRMLFHRTCVFQLRAVVLT